MLRQRILLPSWASAGVAGAAQTECAPARGKRDSKEETREKASIRRRRRRRRRRKKKKKKGEKKNGGLGGFRTNAGKNGYFSSHKTDRHFVAKEEGKVAG